MPKVMVGSDTVQINIPQTTWQNNTAGTLLYKWIPPAIGEFFISGTLVAASDGSSKYVSVAMPSAGYRNSFGVNGQGYAKLTALDTAQRMPSWKLNVGDLIDMIYSEFRAFGYNTSAGGATFNVVMNINEIGPVYFIGSMNTPKTNTYVQNFQVKYDLSEV